MRNVMIRNQQAVISYDSEIEMFRGEFVGLNGGADFYAPDVAGLRHEGEISLTELAPRNQARIYIHPACCKRAISSTAGLAST